MSLDAVVLVDGGTDSLMRGDEHGLGTPTEDMTSLAAVAGLDVPTKLLTCIGFGVDVFLRLRIQEDRRLFRELARTVNHTIRRHIVTNVRAHRNRRADIQKARPGIVVAQHSWGSTLNFHPHFHLCINDGAFTRDGEFYRLWDWKPKELLEALRRAILRSFVRLDKLTPQAADITGATASEAAAVALI